VSPLLTPDIWDASQWLLNVANGTLDLQSGELHRHDRLEHLTKCTGVTYDPDALCPTWERFLLKIFDNDLSLCDYIQRAVGYSMTGTTGEQNLHLMYGTGSNGKSTFLKVMKKLLGEYGAQADFNSFLDSKFGRPSSAPSDDIARLAGRRMVHSTEAGEGKRFDEALIKRLTGGDTITARFLHSASFEYEPQFKLWLAANHKPVIRGTDHAIWRRVRLIPFTITIRDEEKDDQLDAKLAAELPGILAWAVRGCQLWLETGLCAPESVRVATEEYREESDVLGAFVDECCEVIPDSRVRSSELFGAYGAWAKRNREYEMSQTQFGRKLTDKGYKSEKVGSLKYRVGLVLRAGTETGDSRGPLFGNRE
jgi:putative DNA primase/helicase